MKICLVGPGALSIPPKGWGAVEILVDDYRKTLISLGHHVDIVNTNDLNLLVGMVNSLNPDFVHIQYDEFAVIVPYLTCKNVALTSHYGYLEQTNRWDRGYIDIFWNTVNSGANLFCLSQGIANVYKHAGVPEERLFVTPNGVRTDLFRQTQIPKHGDKSIYLAKIEERKRQVKFQGIPNLLFAGNCVDSRFDKNDPNYLGEWSKSKLYEELTDYSNLVLLSDGEAHPLVCIEALAVGLGLVISQYSVANLNLSKDFIDFIPESRINDIDWISSVIQKNREKSNSMRKEIVEYSKTFDWKYLISTNYIDCVHKICERNK